MLLNFLNCKYIIPGFINFTNWVCHVVIFITFLLFYKSQPPNKCLRQSYILVLENNQRHILYKSMKYIDWEGLFKWNRQYSIWWFSMNHQIISMKGTLSKFLNLQIEKKQGSTYPQYNNKIILWMKDSMIQLYKKEVLICSDCSVNWFLLHYYHLEWRFLFSWQRNPIGTKKSPKFFLIQKHICVVCFSYWCAV